MECKECKREIIRWIHSATGFVHKRLEDNWDNCSLGFEPKPRVDWEKQRKAFIDGCKDGTFTITKTGQKEILNKFDKAVKEIEKCEKC